jgi:large exoprotein involved in heme utilization and adhesion
VNLTVADTLTLLNGAYIGASTFGAGRAGSVTISTRNLLVDGQGSKFFTGISSSTYFDSTGSGGNVNLTVADTLTLLNGGQISTSSMGGGNAGNINITTPHLTLADGSKITATSDLTTGGNLLINAADLRLLNGGEISTSVFGDPTTAGGNVEINSRTAVALDGSKITAQAKQGKGGNILVNTDVFLHNAPSIDDVLNASSESTVTGNQGSVTVNTALDPGRSIVGISRRLGDLNDTAQDPCARRKGQKKSTLTKVGRGGLPADNRPEGMTTSLSGGDWTPPAEPASVQSEPLALNVDRDDCRL